MTRWKLLVEYDGAPFCGWQRQLKDITVQQILEEAIESFSGERVSLHVAGRTDAGVHAEGQVAHFDLERETKGEIIRDAVNAYLRPHKIAVLEARHVHPNFHARFKALNRQYRYRICNRRAPLTIAANYAWHVIKPLNAALMQQAADFLIGTHDFTTFRAQDCQATSPIRTLERLRVCRDRDDVTVHTVARSYLYHQVRNMVGSLSLVGTGKWSLADFERAFLARDRTQGGPTAPPQGLFLCAVDYPPDLAPTDRSIAPMSLKVPTEP